MPYTKTKTVDTGTGSQIQCPYTYRNWNGATWTVQNNVYLRPATTNPKRIYRYQQWNVTPGYKALLAAQKFLPTLEYQIQERMTSYSPIINIVMRKKAAGLPYIWYDVPTYTRTWWTPSESVSDPTGWPTLSFLVNLSNDSQHKTLAKVRDMKVNLPVMFGEGRKTVNMITDTAKRLGNAYLSFLRKDFKRAAKYLDMKEPAKGLSSHWLAYQYGWRPLLSDAQGLSELASEWLDETQQRPPVFTVTAKADSLRQFSRSRTGNFVASPLTTTEVMSGKLYIKAKSGLKVRCVFRPSALAAQLGMANITDGLLLAWELVPFSFVFDWFYKVGQYLESASALSGFTVIDGFTTRSVITRDMWSRPTEDETSVYRVESGILHPAFHFERFAYRYKWMGTTPDIVYNGPSGLSDSTTRLRSAAALFVQLCSGDRKPHAYRP